MVTILPSASRLFKALQHQGIEMPKETVDVNLEMPADGVFQLVYRCNIDHEDLIKWGKAMTEVGEELAIEELKRAGLQP